jgi:8-oxo-dGTP diphosphatase
MNTNVASLWRRRAANLLKRLPWLVGTAYTLYRWRQTHFSAGVVGVVLNAQRQVLLAEHVFHPRTPWGLPGGWIDRGETPSNALLRELHEELALTVRLGPILLVDTPFGNHIDLAYLCQPTCEVGALSDELLSYGWFSADALPPLRAFHRAAIHTALVSGASST